MQRPDTLACLGFVLVCPIVTVGLQLSQWHVWSVPITIATEPAAVRMPIEQTDMPAKTPPIAMSKDAAATAEPLLIEQPLVDAVGAPVAPVVINEPLPNPPTSIPWATIALAAAVFVWLVGICCQLLRFIIGTRRIRKLCHTGTPGDEIITRAIADEVCRRLQLKSLPTIRLSCHAAVPMVTGLRKPIILLPDRAVRDATSEQIVHILIHECAHIVRRDLLVSLVQRFVATVYWPHFHVHMINRRLSRAREEVCDNFVLAGCDGAKQYAETLFDLAQNVGVNSPVTAALGLFEPRWQLEQRVADILDEERVAMTKTPRRMVVFTGTLLFGAALVVSGLRVDSIADDVVKEETAEEETVAAETEVVQPQEVEEVKVVLKDDANSKAKSLAERNAIRWVTRLAELQQEGSSLDVSTNTKDKTRLGWNSKIRASNERVVLLYDSENGRLAFVPKSSNRQDRYDAVTRFWELHSVQRRLGWAPHDLFHWIDQFRHNDPVAKMTAKEKLLEFGRVTMDEMAIVSKNRSLVVHLVDAGIPGILYSHSTDHVNISDKSNQLLDQSFGRSREISDDNDLGELPRGKQVFAGVPFYIGDGCLALGSLLVRDNPKRIDNIQVDKKFDTLNFLHAAQHGDKFGLHDGKVIARYIVHYEDKSTASIPVTFGEDVRDWWNDDRSKSVTRGGIAWTGNNAAALRRQQSLRLYIASWKNPQPDKKVTHIDFVAEPKGFATAFCVAMTMTREELQ